MKKLKQANNKNAQDVMEIVNISICVVVNLLRNYVLTVQLWWMIDVWYADKNL